MWFRTQVQGGRCVSCGEGGARGLEPRSPYFRKPPHELLQDFGFGV